MDLLGPLFRVRTPALQMTTTSMQYPVHRLWPVLLLADPIPTAAMVGPLLIHGTARLGQSCRVRTLAPPITTRCMVFPARLHRPVLPLEQIRSVNTSKP